MHGQVRDREVGHNLIEIWCRHVPESNIAEIGQDQRHLLLPGLVHANGFAGCGKHLGAAPQLDLDARRSRGRSGGVNRAEHFDAPVEIQHFDWLGEHVADEGLGHELQPGGAVDAAGFQVVNAFRADRRSFRWDIAPAGVHGHREQVFAGGQVVSDLVPGGQVAAQVLRQRMAVEGRRRADHNAIELQERAQPMGSLGQREMPAVDPDLLPGRGVPVLPGKLGHAMGQRDL